METAESKSADSIIARAKELSTELKEVESSILQLQEQKTKLEAERVGLAGSLERLLVAASPRFAEEVEKALGVPF